MKFTVRSTSIVLSIIALPGDSTAQAPDWLWAHAAGGSGIEECSGVAVDPAGNVLVAAAFRSTSFTFGSSTVTNAGSFEDVLVLKYDAGGAPLWARSAGGAAVDEARAIATDAGGNVYVTGLFVSSTITFGSTTLTNAGGLDLFVVKYDPNGNVLWASGLGGPDWEEGRGIATDAAGNVYVTGYYVSEPLTFGGTTLTNTGGTNESEMMILKYDTNGNPVWAVNTTGWESEFGNGIATDASGNVYVTGVFDAPTADFGGITLMNTVAGCGGNCWDAFVAKYDAGGNVIWATGDGGQDIDEPLAIAVDAAGNSYIVGQYFSATFTAGDSTITNGGIYEEAFIVRYDASGNATWVHGAGGPEWEVAEGVATDTDGNAIVTGYFGGTSITFGIHTLINVDPAGGADMFTVKYDAGGSVIWALDDGGTSDDAPYAISATSSGDVVIAGIFHSTTLPLGSSTLNLIGTSDLFTGRISGPTGLLESTRAGSLHVQPNPFTSETEVRVNFPLKNGMLVLEDMLGQRSRELRVSSPGPIVLSSDGLTAGPYVLRLVEEGRSVATCSVIVTD